MTKNKKLLIGIGIVVLIGIALVGILRNRQQVAGENVVRVGVILPLTGALGYEGERLMAAIQYAQTVVNNRDVKLLCYVEDGKYTVKDSVQAFLKLENQNKIDIWIIYGDLPLTSLKELLLKTAKPVICMIGAQELIKGHKNFIHFSGSIVAPARTSASYAIRKGIKNVAVIYHKEQIGDVVANEFVNCFVRGGGDIACVEPFVNERDDMKVLVSKAMSKQPDAIFVYAYGPSYISILNQIIQQGYSGMVLTDSNVSTVRDKLIGGGDGIVYADFDFGDGCKNARTIEFIKKLKSEYGVDASSFSAFMFEAVSVLSSVINDSGTDVNAIVSGFTSIKDYPSIVGNLTCVENGELIVPIIMKKTCKGGAEIQEY